MKKILFILTITLLSGCGCILSQIPPQKVYATATSCTALLPDYRAKIIASDNCEITSLVQTPTAGYVLGPTNKTITVTVKATDASGNFRQVVFSVTLLDTVKPMLTIDPSLLAYQMKQIDEIYNFGDRLIIEQEKNLNQQSWIDSIPGLREKLGDSTYYKKQMLTWTSLRHAITGEGGRWFTFVNDNDTLILRR